MSCLSLSVSSSPTKNKVPRTHIYNSFVHCVHKYSSLKLQSSRLFSFVYLKHSSLKMSIASPKLSPIILATNNNSKNPTNSSPKLNNNNTSRTSNGNDSIKSLNNHKKESFSDRQIRVLHSSDDDDDDDNKPLVTNIFIYSSDNSFYLGQKSRCYKW